jgi:hypothetical protein
MSLVQPILSKDPEPDHDPSKVLTLADFLVLLKAEEDYFPGEENNTKLMITRLRKIFYDKLGWDTMLIRQAAGIEGRFLVRIVDCNQGLTAYPTLQAFRYYVDYEYKPKCRKVTYRENDRVYGNTRVDRTPEIYADDHADVLLPDGFHCDIGHVLAGLDALQYPQIVSPLPDELMRLYPFFPYAKQNADVVTWLGDIATSAADFLFHYLREGHLPDEKAMQCYINRNASASDMVGNIDSYVIHDLYKERRIVSMRVSEMLRVYYGAGVATDPFNKRFEIFTKHVGLGRLNGDEFENERDFLTIYEEELRSTISFMVYQFVSDSDDRYRLPYKVWKKNYEPVIQARRLLVLFLDALKKQMVV